VPEARHHSSPGRQPGVSCSRRFQPEDRPLRVLGILADVEPFKCIMYAIPVTIERGVITLPPNVKIPTESRTAMLVLDPALHTNDDLDSLEFDLAMLQKNPSLEFLESEPDIYSIEDVKPENRNPYFVKR